ncbi:hypothetical protein PF010_g32345 [Phytophthora fragariae]|uniref:Uncharacterized protein n=1 Tax=Phytophthora fragariae TaxID=53985 RepID=A0A6G0JFF1_9STRA|nr:hypothetical protein PF010_g32345 [Phytophthora fragariae]
MSTASGSARVSAVSTLPAATVLGALSALATRAVFGMCLKQKCCRNSLKQLSAIALSRTVWLPPTMQSSICLPQ